MTQVPEVEEFSSILWQRRSKVQILFLKVATCDRYPISFEHEMRWTTSEYTSILTDSLEVYRKADAKACLQIIKEIMHKISEAAKKDRKPVPEDLSHVSLDYSNVLLLGIHFCIQKIRNWMHNHRCISKEQSSDSDDMENTLTKRDKCRNWTFQGVVEHHIKATIVARAEELAQANVGKTEFLSNYRWARTEICNELSPEERIKYEEMVGKWNTEPLPQRVQRE